jgi:hypothetical protein
MRREEMTAQHTIKEQSMTGRRQQNVKEISVLRKKVSGSDDL